MKYNIIKFITVLFLLRCSLSNRTNYTKENNIKLERKNTFAYKRKNLFKSQTESPLRNNNKTYINLLSFVMGFNYLKIVDGESYSNNRKLLNADEVLIWEDNGVKLLGQEDQFNGSISSSTRVLSPTTLNQNPKNFWKNSFKNFQKKYNLNFLFKLKSVFKFKNLAPLFFINNLLQISKADFVKKYYQNDPNDPYGLAFYSIIQNENKDFFISGNDIIDRSEPAPAPTKIVFKTFISKLDKNGNLLLSLKYRNNTDSSYNQLLLDNNTLYLISISSSKLYFTPINMDTLIPSTSVLYEELLFIAAFPLTVLSLNDSYIIGSEHSSGGITVFKVSKDFEILWQNEYDVDLVNTFNNFESMTNDENYI
ncbi:MAG: hypothetical protein GY830_01920 [Bacteroidetes bacterium]|nr:hypothetical protein [Bacteroidota bacterium]